MQNLQKRICAPARERGQALTEYVLILGMVVIPIVIGMNKLAEVVKEALASIAKLFWGPGI